MSGARFGALLGLAGAAMLGGCNVVVSPTPMFTAADGAGAPALKPGLWLAEKPDCPVDEAKPAGSWPDCANGVVVTAGEFLEPGEKGRGKPGVPYVIAAGDPLVLQARPDVDVQAGASASASGDAHPSASATVTTTQTGPQPYLFIAIHPLAFDTQGRMIRVEDWPVMCGPPPPEPKPGTPLEQQSFVTRHPLPGLKVKDQVCIPADKAAVLRAAKASRDFAGQLQTSHWVRAGAR